MREVEDEESAWGEQIRKDWNELEVEGIDQWMKLVENKGWLSNTLRSSGGAGSEGEDTADGLSKDHYILYGNGEDFFAFP